MTVPAMVPPTAIDASMLLVAERAEMSSTEAPDDNADPEDWPLYHWVAHVPPLKPGSNPMV